LLFIPIVESLAEIICTGLEYFKGLVSKPVLKINKDLQELQAEISPIDTVAMGFQHYDESEYYDEDDDYEDKKTNKVKCGFH
jgi:hypothetical protein